MCSIITVTVLYDVCTLQRHTVNVLYDVRTLQRHAVNVLYNHRKSAL